MNGEELKAARTNLGWSRADLARILSEGLGRSYSHDAIGRWERGGRPVPKQVRAFLDGAGGAGAAPPLTSQDARSGAAPPEPDDTAPTPDGPPHIGPESFIVHGNYAAICEQFFELVATGVGMIGAATGNEALRADGRTILDDKAALGAAYGKLAETNETFRSLLMQTDRQGAYLAVALATGTTAGRIWQNHAASRPAPIVSADQQLRDDMQAASDGN